MPIRLFSALTAAVLLVVATSAAAQWAWRDASGSVVFSDQPPPAGTKPSQIIRQPGGATARPSGPIYIGEDKAADKGETKKTPAANAVADSKPAAPAAPKTVAERDMDARKRAAAKAEADKKAGEEQTQKQQLAAECERLRGYLRALEDGRRIAHTDAQGNQVFLDDSARATEVARVRETMRACN